MKELDEIITALRDESKIHRDAGFNLFANLLLEYNKDLNSFKAKHDKLINGLLEILENEELVEKESKSFEMSIHNRSMLEAIRKYKG